jgi:hypothetical protein
MGQFYSRYEQEFALPPSQTKRSTTPGPATSKFAAPKPTPSKAASPEHSESDSKLTSSRLPSKNRQKDDNPPKKRKQQDDDDDDEATGSPPHTKRKKASTKNPKHTGESDVLEEKLAKMFEMQWSGNFPWLPPLTPLQAKAWAEGKRLETQRKAKATRERRDAERVQQYKRKKIELARAFHAWR